MSERRGVYSRVVVGTNSDSCFATENAERGHGGDY
jgi:hypothetical protein